MRREQALIGDQALNLSTEDPWVQSVPVLGQDRTLTGPVPNSDALDQDA